MFDSKNVQLSKRHSGISAKFLYMCITFPDSPIPFPDIDHPGQFQIFQGGRGKLSVGQLSWLEIVWVGIVQGDVTGGGGRYWVRNCPGSNCPFTECDTSEMSD